MQACENVKWRILETVTSCKMVSVIVAKFVSGTIVTKFVVDGVKKAENPDSIFQKQRCYEHLVHFYFLKRMKFRKKN